MFYYAIIEGKDGIGIIKIGFGLSDYADLAELA